MLKQITFCLAASAFVLSASAVEAREQIRIVGSSTVYPFVTVAAEEFGNYSKFKTPIIEATGTGGGFKLFCSGIGEKYPDFSNASRAIKQSEIDRCAENDINEIAELKIGYDGIVLANSIAAEKFQLTKNQIFLALAKQVPLNGELVDNYYQKWNEVDPSLPDQKIEVYGPPPTSGTRDAFVELVLEPSCKDLPEFLAAIPDKKQRAKNCHLVREDGRYIEVGENDNLIVQKLIANKQALGIFGFSFLDENGATVQGSVIEGVEPSFENISSGSYGISRPLFVYVKNAHSGLIPGVKEFALELVSDNAIGEEGYLVEKGLIPLSEDDLDKTREAAAKIK
ncbi:MAG: substrate-binding domain-containing protein [Robiginitomaculum sp.]|nr:substrate-binding domain-containing protein [Robiginitomaculum sp.]